MSGRHSNYLSDSTKPSTLTSPVSALQQFPSRKGDVTTSSKESHVQCSKALYTDHVYKCNKKIMYLKYQIKEILMQTNINNLKIRNWDHNLSGWKKSYRDSFEWITSFKMLLLLSHRTFSVELHPYPFQKKILKSVLSHQFPLTYIAGTGLRMTGMNYLKDSRSYTFPVDMDDD